MIHFPISGVETYWWLPILAAFVVSTFTSTGGISGAFLILPFQISVLGFTGPAVSSTNLLYNVVAIPSGVYRYYREKRMVWPLTWAVILGTLPGVFLGAIIRIKYLPDPHAFRLFAGLVLLYIGVRLALDLFRHPTQPNRGPASDSPFEVSGTFLNWKRLGYDFEGEKFQASTWGISVLSLVVGMVGGVYGIGGGAIIAPFFVAIFRLPVHTIAGAALMGTFVTSVFGVVFYALMAPVYAYTGLSISPDWFLGLMFGIGGAAGMYTGARLQRYIPARVIKAMLAAVLLFVATKYVLGFFFA